MRRGDLRISSVVGWRSRFLRRFRADQRGATAVEFAMVATPFFLMMMGIMTVGMQYLTLHSLEHAVSEASRQIRTGQAQKAGLTVDDFRQIVCKTAEPLISCDSRLILHIRSGERFEDLVPAAQCLVDGGLAPASGGAAGDSIVNAVGEESRKVSITACYDWDMGSRLWQSIWGLISPTPVEAGKTILSAATVLQTEPYQ